MAKQYDIELGGTMMTPEVFEELSTQEMLGGIQHKSSTYTIVYDFGCYSSARKDMRKFWGWCTRHHYKVESLYRGRELRTTGGEFTVQIITYGK